MTNAETPHIALFLPNLAGGGAERIFVQMANAMSRQGVSVELVLASAVGPFLAEVDDSVPIKNLGQPRVSRAIWRLVRYLRQRRPALLLSGLIHANVAALVATRIAQTNTICVASIRSLPTAAFRYAPSRRSWAMLQCVRWVHPFADLLLTNSRAAAADLQKIMGSRTPRTHVVYNPIDVNEVQARSTESLQHPWVSADEAPLILAVGRLDPLKDFTTLIAAFGLARAERPCRLAIVGEGPQRAQLETQIRKSGLQSVVLMPGFDPNPFRWMRAASLLVSSSLTESCPNVILQALACDLPVVATRGFGGSSELLADGQWGDLVAAGDAGALADAIVHRLDTGPISKGSDRAVDFSVDRLVPAHIDTLFAAYHDRRGEAA